MTDVEPLAYTTVAPTFSIDDQVEGALARDLRRMDIEEGTLEVAATLEEAVAGADAIALVTEWAEFTQIDWPEIKDIMRGNLVIDGRNALDQAALRAAGFTYEGIGRPYP